MIAFRKLSIVLLFIFAAGTTVNAQRRGDLGILFSSDELSRIGLEYRMPIGDRYRLRATLLAGSHYTTPYYHNTANVVLASDTAVVYRNTYQFSNQYMLRLGGERQFGASVFSIGADAMLGYRKRSYYAFNTAQTLNEAGNWEYDYSYFEQDNGGGAIATSDHTYYWTHNLRPGLRLSLSADLPLGDAFLVHFSAAGAAMANMYIGADGDVPEEPFFTNNLNFTHFFFETSANVGIRYKFGSLKGKWKNRKRKNV